MTDSELIERAIRDYGDACFRCGEYPGDSAARYAELDAMRSATYLALSNAVRSYAKAARGEALTDAEIEEICALIAKVCASTSGMPAPSKT